MVTQDRDHHIATRAVKVSLGRGGKAMILISLCSSSHSRMFLGRGVGIYPQSKTNERRISAPKTIRADIFDFEPESRGMETTAFVDMRSRSFIDHRDLETAPRPGTIRFEIQGGR